MKVLQKNKTSSDTLPFEFERPFSLAYYLGKGWRETPPMEIPPTTHIPDFKPTELEEALDASLKGLCIYRTSLDSEESLIPYRRKEEVEVIFAFGHNNCFRFDEEKPAKRMKVSKRRDSLARLRDAAKTGDEVAFLSALKEVNWLERSASEYISGINLALEVGAHVAARELSAQGATRYPENAELQKRAYILSPPKVTRGTATTSAAHRQNRDWLKAHSEQYRGKWVALRDGELLGATNTMEELVERIGSTKGILLTVV